MKRLLDITLAATALAITSPLLAVIGLLVRLDSRGPVIFRQCRVGRSGVLFDIFKFRTMRTDVEGPIVTAGDDARVTRVGRYLRATKLDELPQLVNVVRGDMSFIGPRPEVPQYVELWPPTAREVILSVRPGISDPASIAFRRESELLAEARDPERFYRETILPQKVDMYVAYVRSRSLIGDFRIAWRTLTAVVKG